MVSMTRREFMKASLKSSLGFLALVTGVPAKKGLEQIIKEKAPTPGWVLLLEVGPHYIPEEDKISIIPDTEESRHDYAIATLGRAFAEAEMVDKRRVAMTEKNMSSIIHQLKQGQYLLESLTTPYPLFRDDNDPKVLYNQDPGYAQIFNHLGGFLLDYAYFNTDVTDPFASFNKSHYEAVEASVSYFKEAKKVCESVYNLVYKLTNSAHPILKANLVNEFINLGLAYNSLGDKERATFYYKKALELDKDNKQVKRHLQTIDTVARFGRRFYKQKSNILINNSFDYGIK